MSSCFEKKLFFLGSFIGVGLFRKSFFQDLLYFLLLVRELKVIVKWLMKFNYFLSQNRFRIFIGVGFIGMKIIRVIVSFYQILEKVLGGK